MMRGWPLTDAAAWPAAFDVSLLGWLAAGCLLVAALAGYARSVRERRRNRELILRLDEVETRLRTAQPPVAAGTAGEPPRPADADLVATPSGDVLAGRTSEIERILGGTAPARRSLAEQAILAVHGRLDGGLTPNDLAAALHVSLRTLERGLALYLGCTPRRLILAMRMREARRILAAGDCMVKEVAYRLGFADPYHFSRCFKSFYHVAPSAARPVARAT